MNAEQVIKIIIEEAIYVHRTIGPGMLESVYKTYLSFRLRKRGLLVENEKPIPIELEEIKIECEYKADHVVEKIVIVEIKTIEAIGPLQISQILTYLRFSKLRHGLLLNFNTTLMKHGIKRVVNGF